MNQSVLLTSRKIWRYNDVVNGDGKSHFLVVLTRWRDARRAWRRLLCDAGRCGHVTKRIWTRDALGL